MCSYSVEFLNKEDDEGRIQAISALSAIVEKEDDMQNLLRISFALGNLCHKNEEA